MKLSIPAGYCAAAVAAVALAGPIHAQDSSTSGTSSPKTAAKSKDGKLDKDDRRFMETLARGNLAEIEAGKLARTKTSDERVKQLAEMMVKDHRKANQELLKIASAKGVTLPMSPSKPQQNTLKELQEKTGSEFDKAFVREAMADQEQARKLLDRTAKGGKDPDVKQFAQATLPAVTAHLQLAREISGKKSTSARGAEPASGDRPR